MLFILFFCDEKRFGFCPAYGWLLPDFYPSTLFLHTLAKQVHLFVNPYGIENYNCQTLENFSF